MYIQYIRIAAAQRLKSQSDKEALAPSFLPHSESSLSLSLSQGVRQKMSIWQIQVCICSMSLNIPQTWTCFELEILRLFVGHFFSGMSDRNLLLLASLLPSCLPSLPSYDWVSERVSQVKPSQTKPRLLAAKSCILLSVHTHTHTHTHKEGEEEEEERKERWPEIKTFNSLSLSVSCVKKGRAHISSQSLSATNV